MCDIPQNAGLSRLTSAHQMDKHILWRFFATFAVNVVIFIRIHSPNTHIHTRAQTTIAHNKMCNFVWLFNCIVCTCWMYYSSRYYLYELSPYIHNSNKVFSALLLSWSWLKSNIKPHSFSECGWAMRKFLQFDATFLRIWLRHDCNISNEILIIINNWLGNAMFRRRFYQIFFSFGLFFVVHHKLCQNHVCWTCSFAINLRYSDEKNIDRSSITSSPLEINWLDQWKKFYCGCLLSAMF